MKMGFDLQFLSESSMVGMGGYQSPNVREWMEDKGPFCVPDSI